MERKWGMSFHPEKCSSLPVTRKQAVLHPNYQLHGHTLETATSTKYLGVTITSDLSWNQHIENICNKANKTLGFIRRTLKEGSRRIKELAYKTYVRPTLEYASTVWDPSSQEGSNRIETI